ncbi:MAG: hypothetical protein IH944_12545 [Armatimonadetes bacterium]|nr:hypothetical protein [Armatimonadota bacterium]
MAQRIAISVFVGRRHTALLSGYFVLVSSLGGRTPVGVFWPLVLLPLAVFLVGRTVIAREEEYLLRTFGASYEEYCSRVRRWL